MKQFSLCQIGAGAALLTLAFAGKAQAESYAVRVGPAKVKVEVLGEKVAAHGLMQRSLARNAPHIKSLQSLARNLHPDAGGAGPTLSPLEALIVKANGDEKGYSFTLDSGPQLLAQGTLPDIEVADSKAAALFPGAIVQGQAKYVRAGQLAENPLPRSGGTVTIEGLQFKSGKQSRDVSVVKQSTIGQAITDLVRQPYAPDQSPYAGCNFYQVYSSAQAAYDVDASVSYLSIASVSDAFRELSNTNETHVLIYCRQDYFTATFEPPSTDTSAGLDAFFDKSVNLDLAKHYIGPSNPPLVVDAVTYGSEVYVIANSRYRADDMINTLKIAANYDGVNFSGSFTDHQKSILDTMSVSTMARGGRASAQEFVVQAFGPGQAANAIRGYLHHAINISAGASGAQAIGVPLSYHLSYLDGAPVAEIETVKGTKYTASPASLKSAAVHFHQDGDGKDWDTELDLMLKDGTGTIVAQNHLGQHTAFGDNTTTQDYPINPTRAISRDELMSSGSFDMIIHPNGHDHWNYTAYLTLSWDDGTSWTGIVQNWMDQDSTGRTEHFARDFAGH